MIPFLLIAWFVLVLVTGDQAVRRGLSQWAGLILGLFLGPIGLAIILLMPDRSL